MLLFLDIGFIVMVVVCDVFGFMGFFGFVMWCVGFRVLVWVRFGFWVLSGRF